MDSDVLELLELLCTAAKSLAAANPKGNFVVYRKSQPGYVSDPFQTETLMSTETFAQEIDEKLTSIQQRFARATACR